ncbi:proton-conducting transporter membrane subunit [Thermococcus sp.]|uniref:proton-conducting transporter transmembrane domain-containing protein n=1 Tax=Thermococcus sp. TaxID=35749 RepID=UPI0025D26827|nr:proton-conducting transporter membrane subunit [Thermococcus sp.]
MVMIELVLISALLPFLLLALWKLEGKTADIIAGSILGISLLLNGIAVYDFFSNGSEKVYHTAYVVTTNLGEVFGITLDTASALMGIVSILIAFLMVVYASRFLESNRGKFYALFGLLTGASMVFIYSINLVQFAIALELMAIAMLCLVELGGAKMDALKAFLVLNVGVFLILGAVLVLGNGQDLTKVTYDSTAFLLLIFAAFMMSSQFPFYSWLPDSTASPIPASAYVHSASIVPLGAYMLFRVIQYMKPNDQYFWLLGGLTVALIILMMIYYPLQRDAKRLVAYSTIAQTGVAYITLAYALLGHVAGIQIALYQVVNHAVVKALAFASVGGLAIAYGTTDLKLIKGMRKSVPWTSIAWFMSFLGLAGVLPLGLFFSKAFTIMSTRHAEGIASWLFPGVVLIDAAIFLIVVLLWFRKSFFGEGESRNEPKVIVAVLIVLIIVGIIMPWVSLDVVMKISFAG